MKYTLTNEIRKIGGRTLYRIIAIDNFKDVKIGDLGGFVESYDNLSQDGLCWIYDNACVYEKAQVCNNACISKNALVFNFALIKDNAFVSDYAIVCDKAVICDSSKILQNASVYGFARVEGNSKIYGRAVISGAASICGNSSICGNAEICGLASLTDCTIRYEKLSENICFYNSDDKYCRELILYNKINNKKQKVSKNFINYIIGNLLDPFEFINDYKGDLEVNFDFIETQNKQHYIKLYGSNITDLIKFYNKLVTDCIIEED